MNTHPIIEELKAAGLRATYTCSTNGGEWHSGCPFCREETGDAGKDRLILWPVKGNFLCRRGHKGSIANVLAKQAGIGLRDAQRRLGLPETALRRAMPQREIVESRERWQAKVEDIVRTREKQLASAECRTQRDYLQARGLRPATIRAARIGGCMETRYYDREAFGLVPEADPESGKPRMVCVPEGILIPYRNEDGACLKLQSRCHDDRYGRYRVLPGSQRASMVLLPEGDLRAAVVVESALDCVLCHQEVPEDFAFVALGSTAYGPDATARALFRQVEHLLIATDSDEAGADAFDDIRSDFPSAARLIVPRELGKDIGEGFLAGINIRDWCENGIELAAALANGSARRKRGKPRPAATTKSPEPTSTAEIVIPPFHHEVQFTLVESDEKAARIVHEVRRAKMVAVDIETMPLPEYKDDEDAGLDPRRSRPRLLQAVGGNDVYLFDLNHVAISTLAPLFDGPWVAHNAVFELCILLEAELTPHTPSCTMLMDNALFNRRASLEQLALEHLDYKLDKSQQTSDWSRKKLTHAQLRYAALDVETARLLWNKLRKDVQRRERKRLVELMHGAQMAVALMQLNGIGFDGAAHRKLLALWKKKHKAAATKLVRVYGLENPNSNEKVAELLETHATEAQLAQWPRTDSGKQLSTAADNLVAFADIPLVADYLEYCEWSTRLKSHGDTLAKLVHPETGRLHASFLIGAAYTGRMSAARPNVQGLPREREFRSLFMPEPGHVLVRADYNQMQLRIAGILSGDAKLLAAFESEHDVHKLTAARVLGKKVEELAPGDREKAKAIGFGMMFGMGAERLRSYARSDYGVSMTAAEAERIRDRFFEAYPDLRRWQQEQVREAKCSGCSSTPMGRVRNFTREQRKETYTVAMNNPVQGGEAEVMLAALGRLWKPLEPLDAYLVNCVHDEILCECPAENAEEVARTLRECMEAAMRDVFPTASLTKLVDVGVGPNWADAK